MPRWNLPKRSSGGNDILSSGSSLYGSEIRASLLRIDSNNNTIGAHHSGQPASLIETSFDMTASAQRQPAVMISGRHNIFGSSLQPMLVILSMPAIGISCTGDSNRFGLDLNVSMATFQSIHITGLKMCLTAQRGFG